LLTDEASWQARADSRHGGLQLAFHPALLMKDLQAAGKVLQDTDLKMYRIGCTVVLLYLCTALLLYCGVLQRESGCHANKACWSADHSYQRWRRLCGLAGQKPSVTHAGVGLLRFGLNFFVMRSSTGSLFWCSALGYRGAEGGDMLVE
jgi:hypothetical protein